MTCRRFRTRLSAYLDGELQVPQRDAMRRHLGTCPTCNLELRRLERLAGCLQEMQVPEVPEALTRRILLDASSRMPGPRLPWWARVRFMVLRPVGGVWLTRATACALFLLGITAGTYFGWDACRSARPLASPPEEMSVESTYGLDIFDGAPAGSIEGTYAALALPAEGQQR